MRVGRLILSILVRRIRIFLMKLSERYVNARVVALLIERESYVFELAMMPYNSFGWAKAKLAIAIVDLKLSLFEVLMFRRDKFS